MIESDQSIIQKILQGEKKAYRLLVERHQARALALALRMMKNKEEAEEALQDSFVRAFRALPQFELRSAFPTWFYRIVYNTCLTRLSRSNRELYSSLHEEKDQAVQVSSSDLPPDLALESQEIQNIVEEEILRLPVKYGVILTLFFVQELSYGEICNTTSLPLATVKVRLFRGRVQLRDALVKRLNDAPVQSSRKLYQENSQ
jgi:RNA polymerase sigma-70 factor (ECF subfamily)